MGKDLLLKKKLWFITPKKIPFSKKLWFITLKRISFRKTVGIFRVDRKSPIRELFDKKWSPFCGFSAADLEVNFPLYNHSEENSLEPYFRSGGFCPSLTDIFPFFVANLTNFSIDDRI